MVAFECVAVGMHPGPADPLPRLAALCVVLGAVGGAGSFIGWWRVFLLCVVVQPDIIAAIPEEHKAALLPQVRAKPVRTASGVCVPYFGPVLCVFLVRIFLLSLRLCLWCSVCMFVCPSWWVYVCVCVFLVCLYLASNL